MKTESSKPSQMPRAACCTTSWDDGHPLDLRVADLLAKYNLTGTFYVPLENSRPVMMPAQIRQVSASFEVGAHTTHHVVLTDAPDEQAEGEIRESKGRLESITGRSCEGFCFPKGRFHRAHLRMVCRSGFRFARSVELLSIRTPARRFGVFVVPTTVVAAPSSWGAYVRNGAKRLAMRNVFRSLLRARSSDWTATARAMMRIVAQHGGVFHLWGHSWEVEEQRQWQQLECVFHDMQELRSALPCVPNSGLIPPDSAAEAVPLRCHS
jgi:peptidoglycan/xylan/chitin deacetylase (PgdA/CDA1 family)